MEKQIYDESTGLWYELRNGCYYPCLAAPEEEKRPIGVWGRQHEWYLREHRNATYNALLLSGRLRRYLVDVDQQAQNQYELLVEQMKKSQGITETLKAAEPMKWVGKMNIIRACAREIVNAEIIYA